MNRLHVLAIVLLFVVCLALVACGPGPKAGQPIYTGRQFDVKVESYYHEDVYVDVWFDDHYFPGPLCPAFAGPGSGVELGPFGLPGFGVFSVTVHEIFGYTPREVKVGGHSAFDGKILPISTYRYGIDYDLLATALKVKLVPQKPLPGSGGGF